jgi:hypothetical protein
VTRTIEVTAHLETLLAKAQSARENYDQVMQDTRFHDIIAPARPLSTDELNKRNEAARIRAHAMQNLAEAIVHEYFSEIPF